MAQKIVTLYTDDLTGNESEEVRTHSFALDGVNYEIDLVPDNYDKLFEALEPFISKGRKVSRTKGMARPRRQLPAEPSAGDMRAWARQAGYEVSDRGRVPASVREAYQKAQST
ncbi:histone-like nucleoid-structuring protein Lsr2 [Streptomyces sp. NPDC055134]